jgi:hypothetical protein
MRWRVRSGLVCSVWLALACAGERPKHGSATASLPETCRAEVASGDPLSVDDFEDANLLLASDANLHGLWYVHNDGTGTQSPAADDQDSAPDLIDGPGTERSPAHALHTTGSGFSGWGAFVATRLNAAQKRICSVDLSAYSALTLSLRGSGRVRFNLGTRATTPVADGGDCHQDACSDYGTSVESSDDWQEITVPLASLSQPDWATPTPFDPSLSLRLSFWAESPDFDIWLDDIRFHH